MDTPIKRWHKSVALGPSAEAGECGLSLRLPNGFTRIRAVTPFTALWPSITSEGESHEEARRVRGSNGARRLGDCACVRAPAYGTERTDDRQRSAARRVRLRRQH